MLDYDGRKWMGLGVLFRLYGSALPRALPYALVSLGFALYLCANRNELLGDNNSRDRVFFHPYAHQVMYITVAFLLVFRSNLAYQRFWEGRTQLALMQAKWSDAAAQAVLFDDMDGEVPIESEVYRFRIVHLFSLLHAVSIQTLRGQNSAVL